MNVYQKLAIARFKLKEAGLKQSGRNKGVGYTYFDLSDILPATTKLEQDLGLLSVVTFTDTEGKLTIYNTEQANESITFTSPMREAELRGCHPVQNLGAIETYVRRYLYLIAYEIVETDALDMGGSENGPTTKSEPKDKNNKKHTSDGEKSKYAVVSELLKGSEFTLEDVTEYIKNKYGEEIKINDLSDEQFNHVVAIIKKNKNK